MSDKLPVHSLRLVVYGLVYYDVSSGMLDGIDLLSPFAMDFIDYVIENVDMEELFAMDGIAQSKVISELLERFKLSITPDVSEVSLGSVYRHKAGGSGYYIPFEIGGGNLLVRVFCFVPPESGSIEEGSCYYLALGVWEFLNQFEKVPGSEALEIAARCLKRLNEEKDIYLESIDRIDKACKELEAFRYRETFDMLKNACRESEVDGET